MTAKLYSIFGLYMALLVIVQGSLPFLPQNEGEDGMSLEFNASATYDHYVLALQWGPTMCLNNGCPSAARSHMNELLTFSIHGLWPSLFSAGTQGPHDCTKEKFDSTSLSNETLTGMENKWFSFMSSNTNTRFWSHEWSKHGTCASDFPGSSGALSQEDYFAAVLKLHDEYDPLNALQSAGIWASNQQGYLGKTIADVFETTFRHKVGLGGSHHSGGNYNLLQIYICLNRQFAVIDCESEWHDQSFESRKVFIPEFDRVLVYREN